MIIIKYGDILNYKNIKSNIIEKLLFNNLYYYNTISYKYYLIIEPSIVHNTYINNDKIFFKLIKNNNTKYLDFQIPSFVFEKKIICYDINNDNYYIIINDNNNSTNIKNIFFFILQITNKLKKFAGIISNLIIKITINLENINYFLIYYVIKYVDKLILLMHYFTNLINQLINIKILINKKHDLYNLINTEIENLNNQFNGINGIKQTLENLRMTILQKITYFETGTSRILTNIATIFLPLSFLIAFFSLPFKNVPLQKNNYGFYYIIIIIIIILFIIYYISLNNNNFNFIKEYKLF